MPNIGGRILAEIHKYLMKTNQTKQPTIDRQISIRVSSEHRALFEQAATLKGLSLTDFIVSSAYEVAVKMLELGSAGTRVFAKRILTPRDPAELPELQAAVRQYQQNRD